MFHCFVISIHSSSVELITADTAWLVAARQTGVFLGEASSF